MVFRFLLPALAATCLAAQAWAGDLVVRVTTPDGKPVANAVVMLPAAPGAARPVSSTRAQMAQKDLAFVNPLLAVRTGTKVEFPNLDDTHHNIFSFSAAKRFDLGRYTSEVRPIPSQVFDKAGLITLRCDIHEHMRGLILVLDSPHFMKTDSEGRFKLGGLPAGKFRLKAWLDSKTTLERPVETKPGSTLRVEFP